MNKKQKKKNSFYMDVLTNQHVCSAVTLIAVVVVVVVVFIFFIACNCTRYFRIFFVFIFIFTNTCAIKFHILVCTLHRIYANTDSFH